MKNINKLAFLALAVGFCSCEDYLEVNPEMGVTSEEVYSEYYNFKAAVDRGNNLIHNYFAYRQDWDSEIGALSDEGQAVSPKAHSMLANGGSWLNTNSHEFAFRLDAESDNKEENQTAANEPAGEAQAALRAMNQCLENFHLLTDFPKDAQIYTEEEFKSQLLGQIYFLRGWHYFQIIHRFGGMPIFDHVFQADEEFDVVRPTYIESSDWMVTNMDSAIKYLPEKWDNANRGRATVTTAKALKAMMLLYAASPNMNMDLNPYGSDSKIYNVEMCKRAVEASIEAIKSAESSTSRYEMYSWEEYNEAFYTKDAERAYSNETLLQAPFVKLENPLTYQHCGTGWNLPIFDGGWALWNAPTQNSVDWYETKNGYTMEDARAGKDAEWDPKNPYENRDPRLKNNVWVNGEDMYESNSPSGTQPRTLQLEEGGYHAELYKSSQYMNSGYVYRKFRWAGNNKFDKTVNIYRIFSLIRYPQLYLDFAEAANEAYGPTGAVPGTDMTAVDAINIVRNRVGMPDVRPEYTTDTETFKKRIYNERGVELYSEFHRWADIRRWRLAKDLFSPEYPIKAAYIHEVNGELVYETQDLTGAYRKFDDRNYWYPFTTATMNKFKVFEQNPGW